MARYGTPLRYPGGKQRLAPFVNELIESNGLAGGHYAEPYAGGAGVAVELLLGDQVEHVHLNDSSIHVFSVWQSITKDPDSFCRQILSAALSVEDWKRHREVVRRPQEHKMSDVGFSTFYLNRCNRSGVLTAGVIGGLAQVGRWLIDARFPRNELVRRVESIAAKAHRISVTNLDAEVFIREHLPANLPAKSLVYCDPPYYERAERLYLNTYAPNDHVRIAEVIQRELAGNWLVSYDGHPDIVALYASRRKFEYDLQYSATRSYRGREIFIFSDGLVIPQRSKVAAIDTALQKTGLAGSPA
jgi:DNA adenine methylase